MSETRRLTAGDVLTPDMLIEELLPGVSRRTVLRWAAEGTIPSRKRAGKVFYLRHEIEAWLLDDQRGVAA